MKALNVYQINLIQTLKFMHKTKYGKNPRIFLPKFREVDHQYPTRFSQNSFYYKRPACKTTSFAITLRGPTIWNNFLSHHEKSIPHLLSFLKQIKFKLLNSNKETRVLLTDYDLLLCPTLICSLFVYLVIRKSILNTDSTDSLVNELTLFSDLND